MSNLANVYEFLSEKYHEHLSVSFRDLPSYLAAIIGPQASSKIIFFHKEDRTRRDDSIVMSPSRLRINKANGNGYDLNLTGSPLKDDCVIETIDDMSLNLKMNVANLWSLEEECHEGMSLEKARSIINTEEFQCGKKKGAFANAQGSAWFLCDGMDREKTLLLQFEYGLGYFTRGIITYRGIQKCFSVNTQSLLNYHYGMIRPGCMLHTNIENTYCLKPNVVLRCNWHTNSMYPPLVNLISCDVTLSQTFYVRECEPSLRDLMEHLRLLMSIRNDILNHKDNETAELTIHHGPGMDVNELHEAITKVMTDYTGFAEMEGGTRTDCDIDAAIRHAKSRQLTDLTDKLWCILECCSSYKDLKVAFNILFQCAARCNIVNTPTNNNRLAEIITGVANRRLTIPCLSGTEPLELLLEIGIEKLYKDYEFIFTESKICSPSKLGFHRESNGNIAEKEDVTKFRKSLHNAARAETTATRKTLLHKLDGSKKFEMDQLIGFKNSHFDQDDSAIKLSKLFQLHSIVEHLLMIHNNLAITSLYSEVCTQLLSRPLRILYSIDDSLTDKMEIRVSAHYVRILLEMKDPHTRRITMASNNKFRDVKTTFYYSMENFLPPRVADRFQIEDKVINQDKYYYSWMYQRIKTIHETIKV